MSLASRNLALPTNKQKLVALSETISHLGYRTGIARRQLEDLARDQVDPFSRLNSVNRAGSQVGDAFARTRLRAGQHERKASAIDLELADPAGLSIVSSSRT